MNELGVITAPLISFQAEAVILDLENAGGRRKIC
jgi:hypothetical protein